MSSPFTDEFTKGMEAIISAHPTPESIICCMQKIDKSRDPIIYLSFDCALSYLTYKTMKDDRQMYVEIDNAIARIERNIKEMQDFTPA